MHAFIDICTHEHTLRKDSLFSSNKVNTISMTWCVRSALATVLATWKKVSGNKKQWFSTSHKVIFFYISVYYQLVRAFVRACVCGVCVCMHAAKLSLIWSHHSKYLLVIAIIKKWKCNPNSTIQIHLIFKWL